MLAAATARAAATTLATPALGAATPGVPVAPVETFISNKNKAIPGGGHGAPALRGAQLVQQRELVIQLRLSADLQELRLRRRSPPRSGAAGSGADSCAGRAGACAGTDIAHLRVAVQLVQHLRRAAWRVSSHTCALSQMYIARCAAPGDTGPRRRARAPLTPPAGAARAPARRATTVI